MFPVHDELYDTGIDQPLLFINSFSFQWAENIAKMMKLVSAPNESGIFIVLYTCIVQLNWIKFIIFCAGISKCSLVTLKYVVLMIHQTINLSSLFL